MDPLDKASMRKRMLAKRAAIENKEEKSAHICRKIIPRIAHCKRIGCYYALAQEVQTKDILQYCWEHNIEVALPRVEGDHLVFYLVSANDDLRLSKFHVLEPAGGVCVTEMDILLTPLVAFSADGMRCGYGKGFYDRFLFAHPQHTVGLAFEEQKTDTVYPQCHDRALSVIQTEKTSYSSKATEHHMVGEGDS